ncbi:NLPA lipoprotein, partial [Acinetobacter baumannii]
MKKLFSVLFSASVLTLTACNKQPAQTENTAAAAKDKTESVRTIKLVSTGSDTDVWKYVATLPET